MGKIYETQDGSHSILSDQFGVSYHSKYGAIQESRHVFVDAGLRYRSLGASALSILEIGMGPGLNVFLSLLEADAREIEIYYEALEAYPIEIEQAIHLNYPRQLAATPLYSELFQRIHQSEWETKVSLSPYFTLRKRQIDFESFTSPARFDVIFFDAFAPSAQPELWEERIFAKMYASLNNGGVLVTYCAKGIVKRRLRAVGFEVESLPGPPGKREMTRGKKLEG